ncbi:hypothetical protein D1818_09920 [Aquimarina sp. BL5]|nr:hypothetical protein D1818_09920 [Aquimarina sp. BL5]RKM90923.1 hypothetical protein D7036_23800 [Aquimarina sp. BL5]
MIKNFIKKVGLMNVIMLLTVIGVICLSHYSFIRGRHLEAIFIGLWAPTILGFLNYFKNNL